MGGDFVAALGLVGDGVGAGRRLVGRAGGTSVVVVASAPKGYSTIKVYDSDGVSRAWSAARAFRRDLHIEGSTVGMPVPRYIQCRYEPGAAQLKST